MIAQHFPGWTLSDLKKMTTRERRFWIEFIQWEINRVNVNKPSA